MAADLAGTSPDRTDSGRRYLMGITPRNKPLTDGLSHVLV